MKIAVSTSSFGQYDDRPLKVLSENGLEILTNPYGRTLKEEEIVPWLSGCVGLIAGTEPLTQKVLEALPELQVVSRCGVGLDNVAPRPGLSIFNTPDGPTEAVAELTLALALDLARQVSRHDRAVRGGQWKKRMGRLLGGQKIGIVGLGRIGSRVAALFSALGCCVAFYDPYVENALYEKMGLDQLLGSCDGLTLHLAGGASTLLDAEKLARLAPGAWLINIARGGLVDEAALYEALKAGKLSGAALDVFGQEPYQGPLGELDTVIMTPHIGSYAREARVKMELDSAINLIAGLSALNLL
jgi:D-3-phosphoglycerate dehydrogenase